MKYRALVADDELMIRRGIISFLKHYEDFEVVCEAEDGEMALEMAKRQSIDVYFVDIMMPFLNGLEFIGELKKVNPDALVVIITGYDRFEYAREAISLGIFDYMLKPLREDAFDQLITRLREELQKNSDKMLEQHYLSWARDKLSKNREGIVSDFVKRILDGRLTADEISQECEYLKVDMPCEYRILVIKSEYQRNEDLERVWDDELLFFAMQNVAKEQFATLSCETLCRDDYGNLVLVVRDDESLNLEEKIPEFGQIVSKYMPIRCTVVSKSGKGMDNIPIVYHAAVRTLKKQNEFSDVMTSIIAIIEKNYKREDLSLQDVADEVNLSIPYLSKLFRREMGITFVDYLTNVRIREAIELLHDDNMKMYEIAENVGYSSQHYFSNVFKKKVGLSPNDYKRSIKEKETI